MARGRGARKRRSAQRMQARRAMRPHETLALANDLTAEALDEFEVIGGAYPLGARDENWDGGAAEKSYSLPADAGCFMIRDGDPKVKGSYTFPFVSKAGGKHAVWGAITAIAGALSGARGGADISSADQAGAKTKVEGYYAKARSQYNDDGIQPPWKAKAKASIDFALERGLDVVFGSSGEYAGISGAYDPAELYAAQVDAMAGALAEADHGTDADPAILAVATVVWAERFAGMPNCEGCDHAYTAHLGTTGPCTMEGCNCDSYEEAETEASVKPSDLVATSGTQVFTFAKDGELMIHQFSESDEVLTWNVTPVPAPSPEPEPATAAPHGEVGWTAIFCPEGKLTSDGRAFSPGAVEWRELPLTLMAMTETSEGGHIGAEVAGRIDKVWRDEAAGLIRASGVFADTEYGNLIASLVEDQVLRGVSVDLAIHNYEVGPKSDYFDPDGNWAPKEQAEKAEPSILDLLLADTEDSGDPTIAVITSAEIGMTTVCPFPAFEEAKIAVGDSLVAGTNPAFWTLTLDAMFQPTAPVKALRGPVSPETVTDDPAVEEDCGCPGEAITAAAAGLTVESPPGFWFDDPGFTEPTAIEVTEEGRIYGHAALWNVCHIGLPGCRTAPHSHTDYRYFHLGQILTEDGGQVPVGQITMNTGHAGLHDSGKLAAAHYDHTGTVAAHVRVGEDEHGIWVAGAINPKLCADDARLLAGSKLSGDWRRFDDSPSHELVALLAVNVPGFPVPRARGVVASGEEGDQVLALVAAGIPVTENDLTAEEAKAFEQIRMQAEMAKLAAQAQA